MLMKLALKILFFLGALALVNCSGGSSGSSTPPAGTTPDVVQALTGANAAAVASCPTTATSALAPVLASLTSSPTSSQNLGPALVQLLPSLLSQSGIGANGTSSTAGGSQCNSSLMSFLMTLETAMVPTSTQSASTLVNAAGQGYTALINTGYGAYQLTNLANSVGGAILSQLQASGVSLTAAQLASIQSSLGSAWPSILQSAGLSSTAVNTLASAATTINAPTTAALTTSTSALGTTAATTTGTSLSTLNLSSLSSASPRTPTTTATAGNQGYPSFALQEQLVSPTQLVNAAQHKDPNLDARYLDAPLSH
jgi:hypothetical protein